MKQDLDRAVEEFAKIPMAAGKVMRNLLSETDPEAFLDAAIPLLRASPEKLGTQYLLTLLLIHDLILRPLVDPVVFSREQAIAIARQLVKIEPLLDIKMMRQLVDSRVGQDDLSKRIDNISGLRLLEIMAEISDGARILPVMAQLLHHANPKIRSKAALLVGRSNKNCKWVEQRLGEADPRVRANAVESLWGVDTPEAKNVFWGAAGDTDNRVAGNALMGLYRLGEASSIPLIVDLLSHLQPEFRVTGLWVMGETGDPRFLSLLARMIGDPDLQVRAPVFRSIAKLKQAAAKYPAAPNLHVHLTPTAVAAGVWRESLAAVWEQGPDGVQPVNGLRPTQFILYEDSRVVTQYEVREQPRVEGLSIAFALPRIAEKNHLFHAQCEAAFQAALAHKRKFDGWLTLKYLCEKERPAAAVSAGSKRIFQIEEAPDSAISDFKLPADTRFQTDAETILSAVEAPGSRLFLPRSPMKAIEALLPVLSHCRGSRHLVFVYHPDMAEADWERCRELAKAALRGRVVVHVVAFAPQPELAQLSAKTAGTFTVLGGPNDLPAALEGLCASLVSSYTIRYRSTQEEVAAAAALRVRVYRPGGYGEGVLDFVPQLLPNAEVA